MTRISEAAATQVRDLCQRYRVRRLELFGSATRDDFDPERSDFDFVVDFEPMPPIEHADCYFGLLEGLTDALGRHVDLAERPAIRNPRLLASIAETGRALYAA